jgi:hypothetical protein
MNLYELKSLIFKHYIHMNLCAILRSKEKVLWNNMHCNQNKYT